MLEGVAQSVIDAFSSSMAGYGISNGASPGCINSEQLGLAKSPSREGGGIKHDSGKPRMELLDPYAMGQVSLVLTKGADKYSAYNWTNGIAYGRMLGAALRHIFAYIGGEDLDKETGLPHIAHAMAELMFLLGMSQRHPELDDREGRNK